MEEDIGITALNNLENSDDLMNELLSTRTNDPESNYKKPLTYLSLEKYLLWWDKLNYEAKEKIEARWGKPQEAIDLESNGFAIHGIKYGNIAILIQPSRGYDPDNLSDLHSPDLPPPHRYLAQYLWIRNHHKSNLVVHLGKHGSLEWLPGKSVGLSSNCAPHIALGAIPNIYPFIVNDPGEGSQAKRRSQAVIIDHLTPPLSRSELYGDLQHLESLLDEYFESNQFNSNRTKRVQDKIINILNHNNWPGINTELATNSNDQKDIDDFLNKVDSYLCEIKESQIRTGLHIFGESPGSNSMLDLFLSIVRAPTTNYIGITQKIAQIIELELDPWGDNEGDLVSTHDQLILKEHTNKNFRTIGDVVAWIEQQAKLILTKLIKRKSNQIDPNNIPNDLIKPLKQWLLSYENDLYFQYIISNVLTNLENSPKLEKDSFINAISGLRVNSGPSGAPSRGRPEVLPTGRNFYSVDLRGLPTESAWDLGRRSAINLLEIHLQDEGAPLTHLAMSVWGTSTMRNGGEDIAQLLYLMGIKPIWDGPSRRVVDLEIIPIEQLQRPRVDVTLRISGFFRDAFPQLICLVYKAHNLIGNLNELKGQNPLSESIKLDGVQPRIFGSAPGAYGAGLQALIDSGCWDSRADLVNAYLAWSQWSYDDSDEPSKDCDALKKCLKKVQVVLQNQDNKEHDILDSDDYYQFHGGLAAAVEELSGKIPKVLIGDHSRFSRPRIHSLEKEIDKVMRTRVLNPKWLEGVMNHGYKGAFEMGASIDYLFAYDASTRKVPNWCYSAICKNWLENQTIKEFLLIKNPWVLRDISERLLEASNRGLWTNIKESEKKLLKEIVLCSEGQIEGHPRTNENA